MALRGAAAERLVGARAGCGEWLSSGGRGCCGGERGERERRESKGSQAKKKKGDELFPSLQIFRGCFPPFWAALSDSILLQVARTDKKLAAGGKGGWVCLGKGPPLRCRRRGDVEGG